MKLIADMYDNDRTMNIILVKKSIHRILFLKSQCTKNRRGTGMPGIIRVWKYQGRLRFREAK